MATTGRAASATGRAASATGRPGPAGSDVDQRDRLTERCVADLRAVAPAAGEPHCRAIAERVVAAYADPRRGYHDLQHLDEVLAGLDLLADAPDPAPCAASADPASDRVAWSAAWFHDVVHASSGGSPRAGESDEAASARWARDALTALGTQPAVTESVASIVLATQTHAVPADLPDATRAAARALLDADLWILASPTGRFDEYCRLVRREYAHVTDRDYAAGRTGLLRALVDRPHVYATAAARAAWEQSARRNVAREIARLAN